VAEKSIPAALAFSRSGGGAPRVGDVFASRRRWCVCIAGIATTLAWALLAWRSHANGSPLGWMLATVAVTWGGLFCVMRSASDLLSREIIFWAMAFRVGAIFAAPVMEDDHHRFLWDGYRFATTGDPYAEAPGAHFDDASVPPAFREVLDRINHPDVPTIYGPLTEWAFRFAYVIAPARLWPWKLILLGAELAIFALLWLALDARGRLLLAWCPLAIFETSFNAHPDALAIALVVGAWRLGGGAQPIAAGVAAGLAVAAKIFALPLVPFVLSRSGRRAWIAAAATVLVWYGRFWLHGSGADFAGLRAMAAEWEFNSSGFAVVAAMLSPATARVACGLAFAAIWLALFRLWVRSLPAKSVPPPGEWIYGAFLLLSATANPWYALWLWPFAAARISATMLGALAAVSLAYVTGANLGDAQLGAFDHPAWLRPVEFGIVALGVVWDVRKSRSRVVSTAQPNAARRLRTRDRENSTHRPRLTE